MRYFLCLILVSYFSAGAQRGSQGIGSWKEYLPYQGAIDVAATDTKIYCATLYSLFSVDLATNETVRYSKVTGLSETGISTICYDPYAHKLVVAYTNSNIDLLGKQDISNIPGLKRSTVSGDKNIYQIYPSPAYCYLSTGLGVMVLDVGKNEIKDTWYIGSNGGSVKTYGFCSDGHFFYAATEEGLKSISIDDPFPADFHNWQLVSGNLLPPGPCKMVTVFKDQLLALENDTVYVQKGNGWQPFFANGWPIVSIRATEDRLMVSERKPDGAAQVAAIDATGQPTEVLQKENVISSPRAGISLNKEYWVADFLGGLSRWNRDSFQDLYKLNSPDDIASGQLLVDRGIFYATAGTVNDSWNYQYNRSGVFRMKDNYWTSYNQYHYSALDTMMDFITVAADPSDGSIWAGSYGGGLLHIKANDQLDIFKQNSPLGATPGDPGSYRVAGLAFDSDRNLWIANFGSPRELHVLKKSGQWLSFSAPFVLNLNAAAQIIIDDNNQKWIASPLNNGLIVYNQGQNLDDPGDDRWRLYRSGTGNGNLPSNEVTALAKDKNGLIWVGTSNGMAVIQCPQDAFSNSGCEAVLPVIQDGSFANYLFTGQTVRAIAVDGANRKWVSTADGAWLISPEGDKVLAHFTEDNSPLLSSDVRGIAINGNTGEVFFGTGKGICSYKGTATEASDDGTGVLVYPNPVPPGYQGTIGIRGLPENSIVKIVEANGRLVYETRALGGQATWNGRDYKGRQVATGIYIVIAESDDKQEKAVAKIVFISK